MNEPKITTPVPVGESDWASRSHVRTLVLMGATLSGLYLCYRLTVPFLPSLAWALALAVLFSPFQRWLESRIKSRSFAALIAVFVIALIVVAPATFVTQQLFQEATKGAESFETRLKSGEWTNLLEKQPRLAHLANLLGQHVDVTAAIQTGTTWLSSTAQSIVKGSLLQAISLCLTFYLLFFFLRDRREGLQLLRSWAPLNNAEMDRLIVRVDDTIYATIYGTLAVSALQGLLGGLMFWWLGLPSPLLWGVVMALLSVVPVLGAFVVWVPAAIYLILSGHWDKGVILILWGALVVGTIDNLLRPVLAGSRLKLHTALSFISVVGGLILFGAAGLILGPVLLTITMVLMQIWANRIGREEDVPPEKEDLERFEGEGGLPLEEAQDLVESARSHACTHLWATPPPPLQ